MYSKKLVNNFIILGFFCLYILNIQAANANDIIFYGANAYGQKDMIEINLTQGTSLKVGDLEFETQAIDQDPETGYVYYYEWLTSGDEFAYWDPVTGINEIVRTYVPAPGGAAKCMAFAPDGTLYVLITTDRLYSVDKQTGDYIFEGQVTGLETGSLGRTGDFAFSPDGTLYIATYKSLYTININTLESTLLYTDMISGQKDIKVWTGLAYCNGMLYASDIEAANLDDQNALSLIYSIDPATGDVTELFSTQTFLNDLTSCVAGTILNYPPVLDPIGAKTVTAEELLEFIITASDPDGGDILTYSADNLPPGASFDSETQLFSWTPVLDDVGNHTVIFTVTDNGTPPRSDSEEVTITVNPSSPITTLELKGESDTEDTAIGNGIHSLLNYGGSPDIFAVGVAPAGITARALIRWDLSSIPAGSTILSAQMSLSSDYSYGGSITIDAHRVLKPWVEGTLDGQDRQLDNPDSACCVEYGYGTEWDAFGADGAADRAGTIISSATKAGTGWYSWDIEEAVQRWVDGDWANDGLILKANNESIVNMKMFAPSEYQSETFRPTLVVEYVQP